MNQGRLERLAPLSGVLFAVLFAIGILVTGDEPDTKASAKEIIDHFNDTGKIYAGIICVLLGALLMLLFTSILRNALRDSGRAPEWVSSFVFGGGVVYSVGLAIFAMNQIALIDAADLGKPEVAQALNILNSDNFAPAVLGMAAIFFGTAWAILKGANLPKWLGWVAIVLGICTVAGPLGILAFFLFPIWVLVVSIVLYRRLGAVAATSPEPLPRRG